MPIDTSIYGMIRPQQPGPGPLDLATQGLQVRNMLGQQETGDLQRQLLQQQVDLAPREAELRAKLGALSIGEKESSINKSQTESAAAQAKLARDSLAAVGDQSSYDAWRADGASRGWQVAKTAPDVFDPKWQQQHITTADEFIKRFNTPLHMTDLGGSVVPTDPYTGKPAGATIQKTPSLHDEITAATADPFGILGIKDILRRGGAPGGAAAPASPTGAALTIAPPSIAGKDAPAIQVGDWKSLMGSDVHGEEFLKQIPQGLVPQLKAYAEGRKAFPAGFAEKSPYFQALMQMLGQYDPSFDAVNYNARSAARKDFTSGQSARNVTSINTVIGHMDSLSKAADALGNSDYPTFNKAFQAVMPQIGGTQTAANIRTFQQAKEAVANELMRVFRGTGASSSDTSKWAEQINQADSPTALKAVIRSGVDLLDSRIEALNVQYKRGMGTTADVMDLVNPKSKATLDRLRGSGTETSGPAAGPTQAEIDAELVRRGVKKK